MNWSQILKNAVIAAVGAPIVYWVLVQVLGGTISDTLHTYILVGLAAVIVSLIIEAIRQKNR